MAEINFLLSCSFLQPVIDISTENFSESLIAHSLLLSEASYRQEPGISFGKIPSKDPVLT